VGCRRVPDRNILLSWPSTQGQTWSLPARPSSGPTAAPPVGRIVKARRFPGTGLECITEWATPGRNVGFQAHLFRSSAPKEPWKRGGVRRRVARKTIGHPLPRPRVVQHHAPDLGPTGRTLPPPRLRTWSTPGSPRAEAGPEAGQLQRKVRKSEKGGRGVKGGPPGPPKKTESASSARWIFTGKRLIFSLFLPHRGSTYFGTSRGPRGGTPARGGRGEPAFHGLSFRF